MSLPKNPHAYEHVRSTLDAIVERKERAVVAFDTPARAQQWRFEANMLRRLIQREDGWSRYDGLRFVINKTRANEVVVENAPKPRVTFKDEPLDVAPVPNVIEPDGKYLNQLAQYVAGCVQARLPPLFIWDSKVKEVGEAELLRAFEDAGVVVPEERMTLVEDENG